MSVKYILALLLIAAPLHAKPLKVFILADQSNMEGPANVSTFEHIGMDPATKPMLAEMLGAEGLTERERLVLEKGISNLKFHDLGSAKILGVVGKGLAEAMAELKQLTKTN